MTKEIVKYPETEDSTGLVVVRERERQRVKFAKKKMAWKSNVRHSLIWIQEENDSSRHFSRRDKALCRSNKETQRENLI